MAPTMFLCQAMFWKGVRVRWYFSPHLHRSQKSKNEPTEKTVSGQQRMLSYSHLKGMERPVRSFKSFIRTTPSRTSPNKPVPPIPRPLQKIPSSSSVTSINSPSRSTGFSLWEAPSNWDNSDNSQIYSTPPLALRKYSPLIPEPPEDIAAMQTDPALWQLGNGPFPQTALDPIHECNATTPEIPARNPSRLSLSMSKPASTRENSRSNPPSVGSRDSTSTHDEELVEEIFEPPVDGQSSHDVPSPLDLMSALSDMTIKEQAFHSLGIGSPRDQGIVWGGQPQRSDSLQFDNDAYLDSQGNKLITPRKRSFLANDSSFGSQDPEIGDGIHALSFAQDYHNILSDQPFDDHTPCEQIAPPKTPPKDQDLTPRPLEWRKGSDSSPSADVPERPLLMTLSSSGQRQKLKKMGSWVSQHLKSNSLSSVRQKSISAPDDLPPCQVSDSEVDRHPKKEARLANIVQHGKDFVARKVQRRTTEPQMPLVISLPLPQHSAETPEISSVSAAPFELATPLFKLPGGLAIVRQSPLSTPRPQTAGNKPTSPTSPFSNLSWPDFPASSSFRFDFSRRGSCASSCSQVRSSTPMKERLRSFGSLSSIRSFARSSTSPAIPTTQEPSCSYSLPQLRRRSHNVGSPLSLEGGRTSVPEQTSVSPQGAEYDHAGLAGDAAHKLSHAASKLNLLEKAKNARDAWKKVQEEIKKEKLKQSIRLVGPASATDIAGYIKPDSRASGDSCIDEGRLEGSMSKETI